MSSSSRGSKAGSEGPRADPFNILLLGDSIQGQLEDALIANMLLHVDKSHPRWFQMGRIRDLEMARQCSSPVPMFCNAFTPSTCPGLLVSFIRNSYLLPRSDTVPLPERAHDFVPWATDLRNVVDAADMIVLNRGPHFVHLRQFSRELRGTCRLLRQRYPHKLIVYRSSPPGHDDCTKYSLPIDAPQNQQSLPFNWGLFHDVNLAAKEIVREFGIPFLDVEPMTLLRADGHKGLLIKNGKEKLDCLHYCPPGPVDTWVELIYNALLQLHIDL